MHYGIAVYVNFNKNLVFQHFDRFTRDLIKKKKIYV